MVGFRAVSVADEAARLLLAEYFSARALGFPAGPRAYRANWPSAEQFMPPAGVFLIALGEDGAGTQLDAGCVGVRRIEPGAEGFIRFEVKHLWLRPPFRGLGWGRAMLDELEARARALGAQQLVLDTNASLEAASGLYRSSGYRVTAPYNDNPNATHWYLKELTAPG